LRPQFYVYVDENGRYLVLSAATNKLSPQPVFWGDGNGFFLQRLSGGSGKKTQEADPFFSSFEFMFWEPRTRRYSNRILKQESGEVFIFCGSERRRTLLKPLPAQEAKTLVGKATFYKQRFIREPYLLVRDDGGVYYYIDKSAKEGEKDFRLFIGQRGQLKQAKLRDIVQDNEGEIFATALGSLRIAIDKEDEAYWIQGQQRKTLVRVPIELPFIFGPLGMYARQKIGTPCDDI